IGIIEMSKSGAPITKITIPKHGRFRLELEYFNEYTLTFVLSEHFSKTIIVSTEIPQEVWERDSDFPPFPMVVQLFKEIEGIDKSFTLKASGKIFYGKQTDNFEKESYFSDVQMAEQIETAKAQTSQVAKEAEGITKQEAQDLVVKQKNFDQLIKDADVLYQRGEYQLALIKYLEAKQLFPERAYASDRIAELQDLVKALEITERQRAELDQKYKDAIVRANGFFEQKTYVSARPVYEDALQYKPGDVFANGRIQEIDQLLAKEKQKEEERLVALATANNQAFNDAMANADRAFGENDFNTAKSGYEKALAIKVADPVAKQKLGQAEAQLAQLAKMTQAYNTAINVANKHVGDKRYQEAKEKYQEALQYLPDSDYPKQQIVKLDELLAQADAERQKEELYAANIKEGETLFRNKEYAVARVSFVKANELKPSETLPVSRIQEIDKLLAELALIEAKNRATETGYQETIAKADKALAGKEYSSARLFYGEALAIKANEQYPKDKVAEIDQIMADLKVLQYNQAIAAG
ncbi:MAG: hypothetical protein Q7J86_06090, partial [Bacteroidota bacterium]|nr:hypothetical protein [Bacteroidota bacterium]